VDTCGTSPEPLLDALVRGRGPRTVEIAGERIGPDRLLAAAGAVADRVAGAGTVALLARACRETVVGVAGCLAAGVTVVPVPADCGEAEREHILRDSGARLLLVPGTGPPPPARDGSVPLLPVSAGESGRASHPEPPADHAALVLYTSGTTGPAKGVPVRRSAIAADLDALAEVWQWSSQDVLVHGLPLFHVHGLVLGILGALRIGSGLVHTGRPTPARYAAAGGTLYFGVPTVWSRISRDAGAARALSRARLLVSGSAALPAPVHEALGALTGQAPVERYGMTETLITLSARADGPRRRGHVGTPLPGTEARLLGEDGRAVAPDGVTFGELSVRGPTVFDGYLGRPADTAAAFDDRGWFRTGDVATVDEDGWYRIIGRTSTDIISSGGFRIGAGEVEDALLEHPAVGGGARGGPAGRTTTWGNGWLPSSSRTVREPRSWRSSSRRGCRPTRGRARSTSCPTCRATTWGRCASPT